MPNQGRGGRDRKLPSREVTVSKSLSLLLRHAAEREGLKIDSQGYANVADVLAWQKLKSLKVTFPEIISAVESSDKKRYALCYLPETSSSTTTTAPDTPAEDEGEEKGSNQSATATATALASFPSDPDPTHYLIRATQGHSMKTVQAKSGLLEKLTLDNPDKLPEAVVHGTYHSTWPLILASGGLRCMGRNHAHFATGPALQAVLADISRRNNNSAAASTGSGGGPTGKGKENSGEGSGGQVISGMRGDAQVLIYIDIRKALSRGCPFWRSENGVILSEGMDLDAKAAEGGKAIPVDCFDVVVERKKGLGKIWEAGEVIQSLPEELTKKGNPKGVRRR